MAEPHLYRSHSAGARRPALELAERFESSDPRVRVTYVPLADEPGRAVVLGVSPAVDTETGRLHAPGFNQVALDPVTGKVQGRREWGAVSLSRENLLPFLYKLHYSLHLPERGGVECGIFFMGGIAIAWVLDSLVALWLSFPKWSAWRQSFAFRWRVGGYPRVFDLHRSGGVWVFGPLLVLAVTAVSMNLGTAVMRPVVSWFSPLTPTPYDSPPPGSLGQPITPLFDRAEAVRQAQQEAARRGWSRPAGAVFYSPEYGLYGVGFFEPGRGHGDGGLVHADVPGEGTAGDIFMQVQFPLHSGRILGVPGRVLVSVMGLVVAGLSATGVVIWARKRRGRRRAAQLGIVRELPEDWPAPV